MDEPTESSVRAEVRAWLEANWNPELGLVEWRNKLADSGWGVPHWPKQWYGRDLPVAFNAVVDEEFARIGAVGVAKAGIRTLAAATILAHGTDLHKEKFLRRILTGEDTWCQLFSEPGSGSDMAGAVTRADRQGNKWVINGQKVWTTSAHKAEWGLLLARANWDVAKHKGLAYFILDMKQPGVQVHPLKQMNGHASFNQVFFTDAIVEPEMMVCDVGDGWTVATTTLMHERLAVGGGEKAVKGTAYQLFQRVFDHSGEALVGVENHLVSRQHQGAFVHRFDEHPIGVVGAFQREHLRA
jgi:alkylation response protein AidB-like acyl-CoA dehydrogenase